MDQRTAPSKRSLRALDALNFFVADVRDGIGPYLALYLLTVQHWDQASIGVAMSAMGMATVLAQTPCGALIDAIRQKRLLVVVAALLVGVTCAALTLFPTFDIVLTVQVFTGAAAAAFGPAIAAITLGMVGPRMFATRIGRNEAFNHAGNIGTAAIAGVVGHLLGQEWIFYLVAVMALGSIASAWSIRERDIDHDLARAASSKASGPHTTVSALAALFRHRAVLVFALSTTLFHFANAAMLPLAGQVLSRTTASGSVAMSACIIAAQLVMVPVAALAGTLAERWGRKPVFAVAFAVLPVRGLLYTLSDDPLLIVAVQLLDGIGAGIFGVLWITVVADLTEGTGRYNLTLGAIGTAQGIGAALSNLVAGYAAGAWGYHAAFMILAAMAVLALSLFGALMPETGNVNRICPTAAGRLVRSTAS